MSYAPTEMREMLRPALRRAVMLVGVFALLLVGASVIPTHKTFGLFDTGHSVSVEDCRASGNGGCVDHATGQLCSLHTGCVSIGVLPAGPAVAAARGQGWNVGSYPIVADWAELPTKPPPIALL